MGERTQEGGRKMERIKVVAEETPRFSLVLEVEPPSPDVAHEHFRSKLQFETDPADVHADLHKGAPRFALVDTRSPEAFEQEHIPGAVNIPHRRMTPETTSTLPKEKLIVTYCWGPGCNGSTQGAARLSALGFRVKELIGGIEYWKREGYPTEGGSRAVSLPNGPGTRHDR
jgi:rhodanese-related sulfurtransferase